MNLVNQCFNAAYTSCTSLCDFNSQKSLLLNEFQDKAEYISNITMFIGSSIYESVHHFNNNPCSALSSGVNSFFKTIPEGTVEPNALPEFTLCTFQFAPERGVIDPHIIFTIHPTLDDVVGSLFKTTLSLILFWPLVKEFRASFANPNASRIKIIFELAFLMLTGYNTGVSFLNTAKTTKDYLM